MGESKRRRATESDGAGPIGLALKPMIALADKFAAHFGYLRAAGYSEERMVAETRKLIEMADVVVLLWHDRTISGGIGAKMAKGVAAPANGENRWMATWCASREIAEQMEREVCATKPPRAPTS